MMWIAMKARCPRLQTLLNLTMLKLGDVICNRQPLRDGEQTELVSPPLVRSHNTNRGFILNDELIMQHCNPTDPHRSVTLQPRIEPPDGENPLQLPPTRPYSSNNRDRRTLASGTNLPTRFPKQRKRARHVLNG